MPDKGKVLIVEDIKLYCDLFKRSLSKSEHEYLVETAMDLRTATTKLTDFKPDMVVLDLRFPDDYKEGLAFLKKIIDFDKTIKVIVATGASDESVDLQVMKLGAYDFVDKNRDILTMLPFRVDQAYEKLLLEREFLEQQKSKIKEIGGFPYESGKTIVGTSQVMFELSQSISNLSEKIINAHPNEPTVLITGETGSGKELIARVLRWRNKKRYSPFVEVNCAAIPQELVESELFGHVKGAFTGANSTRQGKFEAANGGILFLDEIGEMSLAVQAKLLRVIQEREITRVGENRTRSIDVWIIAATNRDLEIMVKHREFREDLLYRIRAIHLEVPPLRERKTDIPMLAEHFLNEFKEMYGVSIHGLKDDARSQLEHYSWPGNVRELKNTILRAVIRDDDGWIGKEDLMIPKANQSKGADLDEINNEIRKMVDASKIEESKRPKLKEFSAFAEKEYIKSVLESTEGNKTEAAKILGIDYSTLHRKLNK